MLGFNLALSNLLILQLSQHFDLNDLASRRQSERGYGIDPDAQYPELELCHDCLGPHEEKHTPDAHGCKHAEQANRLDELEVAVVLGHAVELVVNLGEEVK